MNVKKKIGALARRHAMGPYTVFYETRERWRMWRAQREEAAYLARKDFKPGTPNADFARTYYHTGAPLCPSLAQGIVCVCDGRLTHGGPTDRLRGILTTYREAKRRGIPFHIHWTHPFDLADYLVPATFDWRITADRLGTSLDEVFPVIIDDLPDLYCRMRLDAALDPPLPQTQVYTNADNARGEYAALYREVFRPSEALQRQVDYHLARLGEEYYAFTFRFLQLLGDFIDHDPTRLASDEARALMERVAREFDSIAATLPAGCRILLTSDSRRFLDFMEGRDKRIYIVPGGVSNIDLAPGDHRDAWMKTFVDQQLLMHARRVWLMRTGGMYKSGFPRFAAEIGGVPFIDHKF